MDLSMFSGFCGSSATVEGLLTCRGLAALIFAFARGKATVPLGIAADLRQQLACYNDSLGLRSGGRQLLGFGRCFLSERHCVFSLVARLCHRRRLFIKQTTCMRCRPLASDCATAVRPQGSASYIAAVPACKEPGTRCARTSVPRRVPNERWAAQRWAAAARAARACMYIIAYAWIRGLSGLRSSMAPTEVFPARSIVIAFHAAAVFYVAMRFVRWNPHGYIQIYRHEVDRVFTGVYVYLVIMPGSRAPTSSASEGREVSQVLLRHPLGTLWWLDTGFCLQLLVPASLSENGGEDTTAQWHERLPHTQLRGRRCGVGSIRRCRIISLLHSVCRSLFKISRLSTPLLGAIGKDWQWFYNGASEGLLSQAMALKDEGHLDRGGTSASSSRSGPPRPWWHTGFVFSFGATSTVVAHWPRLRSEPLAWHP